MIFTDNEPAVKFLKGFHSPKYKHFYLVQQIRQNILTKMKCIPEIYHIHAHQGYIGNEQADAAAKEAQRWSALRNPQLVKQLQKTRVVRCIKDIHLETRLFWEKQWISISPYFPSTSKKWCLKILPTFDDVIEFNRNLHHLSPSLVKSLSRLASGYCNLRSPQFKWQLVNSPDCFHCKQPETITHYLLECSKFDSLRRQLFDKIRILWFKSNVIQDPPTIFSPRTLITAHELQSKYQVRAMRALGEFIRLSRVKL